MIDGEPDASRGARPVRRRGVIPILPIERNEAKHHLIDFLSPEENFSVKDWLELANEKIDDLFSAGRQPIICGGTGLYIDALINPYSLDTLPVDPAVRERLEKELNTLGKEEFYNRLKQIDPESAEKIHPNNTRRVIRALEIYENTGKTKSFLEKEARQNFKLNFEPIFFAPNLTREDLYLRINKRVDLMMEEGLLDEVRSLTDKYDRNLSSLQALGYKEFYPYLDGEQSLDKTIEILKRDTRHFAKRQLTWFRRYENVNFI